MQNAVHAPRLRTEILVGLVAEPVGLVKLRASVIVERIDSYKLTPCLAVSCEGVSHKVYDGRADTFTLIGGRYAKMSNVYGWIRSLPIEEVYNIGICLKPQIIDEIFL